MYLPDDVNILLSVINTKLRDAYASLDDLCGEEDVNREALVQKLAAAGYHYEKDLNAFK